MTVLAIDQGTSAPRRSTAARSNRIGNLNHPVDTADAAALEGRHVAGQVAAYLGGKQAAAQSIRLKVDPPLRWPASPGRIFRVRASVTLRLHAE